jgi:5-methylcytosine-specific restriction enzyme subunit McrC
MAPPISIKEYDFLHFAKERGAQGEFFINQSNFKNLEDYVLKEKEKSKINYLDISSKNYYGKIIRAQNYVGSIKISKNLQIEILPKIYSRNTENEGELTKKIFAEMLKSLFSYKSHAVSNADLDVKSCTIYEFYINLYCCQIEEVIRKGLRSNYNNIADNELFLKGKLIFNEQIKQNIVHKERFFVSYDEFNLNKPENKIIKSTLLFLKTISQSHQNIKKILKLLLYFTNVEESIDHDKDYKSIVYDRNNNFYENIINISMQFLNKKSYNSFSGQFKTQSLLFDMNKLFEVYVAKLVKKYLSDNYEVTIQDSSKFLFENPKEFLLKPDILLENNKNKIIIDTKWKLLDPHTKSGYESKSKYGISISDMYQMLAYAKMYESKKIILIYPYVNGFDNVKISYITNDAIEIKVVFFKFEFDEKCKLDEKKMINNLNKHIIE